MRGTTAAALLVLAGFSIVAADGAGPDFRLQMIGRGVWAAIISDEGLAGGNAGFVIGDDGVAVIDTFQDPRPAKALLDEIRGLTPLPIRFVVNTHYHLDHVNGNDVFAAAGATIVAHRNVRAWMRTENIKMLDPPVTPEKMARVQSLALPTVIHETWIESLDAMQKDYGLSTWVPGHGGVANGQDVVTFRNYLADLHAGMRREQTAGKSGDALVQALLPGLKSRYGNWGFFTDYARADIEQTAQELSGKKRLPSNPQQ